MIFTETDIRLTVRVRYIGEHAPDCYALKNAKNGSWDTPWYSPNPDNYSLRDRIGRKGGSERWIELRCNCTHCSARCLVPERILSSIPWLAEPEQEAGG